MTGRATAAIRVWRSRNVRTGTDRAYAAYMVFMVAVVAVTPIARAVWLSLTSAEGIAVLASTAAPGVTVLTAAGLWAGALILGRDRGPAVLPPFPTHALATSDLPRSDTFRGPVLRAGALVTGLATFAAGLVGGSLTSNGLADPLSTAMFAAVGALVGIVATVAWLAGQVFPRAAVPVALGVLALAAFTAAVPFMQPFTPWGWVGLAYPGSGSPHTLVALTALTAALVAAVPVLLNRLGLAELMAQAARWESAATYATGMEFSSAVTIYQGEPHAGRRLRAVRAIRRRSAVFLIRDAIGAVRTPGRLVVGVIALATAGTLITLAFAPAMPGWALGAAAGLTLFGGLGPFTDGIRHAASVAADFPLYGISDEHLLANHALFPLAVTVVVLLTVVVVCSFVTGMSAFAPILSSLALGVLTLMARVGNALKGPLPPTLLAPIPTPVGDLGAAVRMIWALDAVLLIAFAGAAAALAFESPVLLIGVAITLVGLVVARWRQRT
ncbi:hypothetical protein [Microbacterium sp. UBA3394]|uniref:hypothetical protein n=1 Tax=Microbacterium sp. UBA3394 TaxID=1946945 RepID=UPI00257E9545|nr:hypothetical protein [Microbacterium sp. UBA3394]|tara:strand:- start:1398 stop:2891 length:1494 start_codon:yes stop_codon:yes gene_type:complete